MNRSVEDPNMVTVVAGFETLESAKAFIDNPSLKAKMTEAGHRWHPEDRDQRRG